MRERVTIADGRHPSAIHVDGRDEALEAANHSEPAIAELHGLTSYRQWLGSQLPWVRRDRRGAVWANDFGRKSPKEMGAGSGPAVWPRRDTGRSSLAERT